MEEATATGLLEWHRNIQAHNRMRDFVAISHRPLGDMLKYR